MKKLMFFLGKGGVGKSTISSAAAYKLRKEGKILHVSLDPAHNIGDIYNLRLSDGKQKVCGNLDAIEVNLQDWIDRYLKHSRDEMKANYSYNVTINLDSFFNIMKYSPGTEEYAVLWAIEHIYETYKDSYHTIIFDTPPTALTLRFLAMPTISLRWVEELSRMRKNILEKRQTIMHLNPDALGTKGASKKEDDKVYTKLTSIHSRLGILYDLFTKESYFTVVVNEDKLSLAESIRIREELKKLDITINSICLNKQACEDPDERSINVKKEFQSFPICISPLIAEGLKTIEDLDRIEVTTLLAHFSTKEQS